MLKPLALLACAAVALTASSIARADATVGQAAPEFSLTDTNGKSHALSSFKGKWVVLEWNNPDCPFVKKHYESQNMQRLQKEATGKGVVWLQVNSGAAGGEGVYPAAKLNELMKTAGSAATAYLLDPTGQTGKAYGAKTTPHMFVINPQGQVVYAGAIDSIKSPKQDDIPKATNYVRAALESGMAGKPIETPTSAPYGCSVKY